MAGTLTFTASSLVSRILRAGLRSSSRSGSSSSSRMRVNAGLGIRVGTVLALGRPTQAFHTNLGGTSSGAAVHHARTTGGSRSSNAGFRGSPVIPLAGFASDTVACRGDGRGSCENTGSGRPRWFHSRPTRNTVGGGMSMTSTERQVASHATSTGVEGGTDIFCNRELNMKQIKAVGFDMDYTLAQYFTGFDQLAFDGAKTKLVQDLGYPEGVDSFTYDPEYFSRGLVIDLERGNIIKMDRHRYIRVAFHGFNKLSSEERKSIYLDGTKMHTFTGQKFVSMDTLFSLVDAVLYAHLIEMKDNNPDLLNDKSYEKLFRDVRRCVDLCHRDGVIKDRVEEDPGRYIMPDPEMVPMLKRLRKEGMQVFLLTNSLWDYTHVVMNFLCGNSKKEDRTTEWVDLFDLAITGSCKPGFLVEPHLSLFRVNTDTCYLSNTDGVGNADEFLREGKVFQGGNWLHLHEMLKLSSGDQLLYVGDHMFADILRSKRTLGWRTCLIVPELEGEMLAHRQNKDLRNEVNKLRTLQYNLDARLDHVRLRAMEENPDSSTAAELAQLEDEQVRLKTVLRDGSLLFHSKFHQDWGQLFKSGYQDSRFAKQVATYACIYTSKASNLARMSTQRSFRPVRDVSAHDLILEVADDTDGELEALRRRILQAKTDPSIVDVGGSLGTP